MWHALDIVFMVGHTTVVVFVVLGWTMRATRPWHLVACLLTAVSWVLLGMRYGFGYCFLTDWHWRVREQLGHHDMPNSFIKYLCDTITGWDWNPVLIDVITGGSFILACLVTIVLNLRDRRRRLQNAS